MTDDKQDRPSARLEPQQQITTVMASHWLKRGNPLPTGVLIEAAADFGVTEASARQAIWRLVRRGELQSYPQGRTTRYGIPEERLEQVAAEMAELLQFGSSYPVWDGVWTLVSFSLPANSRSLSQSLKTQFRNMGLGEMREGFWISPHDVTSRAAEAISKSNFASAHIFRGKDVFRIRTDNRESSFATERLRAQYANFIEQYRDTPGSLSPAEAMTTRATLLSDWRSLRDQDHDLPAELLSDDWPRPQAYSIFRRVLMGLEAASTARFHEIIARYDPELVA